MAIYDRGEEGDEFEGECELQVSEFSSQRSKEVWRELHGPKGSKRWEGRVNLKIHYIHSTVKLLQEYVSESERGLAEEVVQQDAQARRLENLHAPFPFLQGFISRIDVNAAAKDNMHRSLFSSSGKMLNYSHQRMVEYEQAPWYALVCLCIAVYGVLAVLCSFYRPDFVNLTIVGIAALVLQRSDLHKARAFFWLSLLACVSVLYDSCFLYAVTHEWSQEL